MILNIRSAQRLTWPIQQKFVMTDTMRQSSGTLAECRPISLHQFPTVPRQDARIDLLMDLHWPAAQSSSLLPIFSGVHVKPEQQKNNQPNLLYRALHYLTV